jgi:hypothetical protein
VLLIGVGALEACVGAIDGRVRTDEGGVSCVARSDEERGRVLKIFAKIEWKDTSKNPTDH